MLSRSRPWCRFSSLFHNNNTYGMRTLFHESIPVVVVLMLEQLLSILLFDLTRRAFIAVAGSFSLSTSHTRPSDLFYSVLRLWLIFRFRTFWFFMFSKPHFTFLQVILACAAVVVFSASFVPQQIYTWMNFPFAFHFASMLIIIAFCFSHSLAHFYYFASFPFISPISVSLFLNCDFLVVHIFFPSHLLIVCSDCNHFFASKQQQTAKNKSFLLHFFSAFLSVLSLFPSFFIPVWCSCSHCVDYYYKVFLFTYTYIAYIYRLFFFRRI